MADRNRAERPPFACEITMRAVSGARVVKGDIDIVQTRSLPAGVVTPSLHGQNITRPEAVREALSEVLDTIGGRGRDIIAVIPDAAVRILLLDFESLPDKREDAEPVVRFRVKKSIPFDLDKAIVSYDSSTGSNGVRVTAAVVLRSVLDEYEAVFRDAGCNPGVVLPSTLAALGAVDGSRPTMLLKLDGATSSVAIVDSDQLLLFRTMDAGGDVAPERVAEDVYPSLVYFQDTYGMNVERVLLSGASGSETLKAALSDQTSARIEELSTALPSGARAEAAGAVGALL